MPVANCGSVASNSARNHAWHACGFGVLFVMSRTWWRAPSPGQGVLTTSEVIVRSNVSSECLGCQVFVVIGVPKCPAASSGKKWVAA